ncbi:MAG: transcription-repair coupling factor [Lachnospiraceae bacterium]|nr:transcription-repair coupling factor [Lachnospiraceae bacterium]
MGFELFEKPLLDISDIRELKNSLLKKKNTYELTGVCDAAKAQVIHTLMTGCDNAVVVCENESKARLLYEELSFYNEDTVYYPAKDILFYQSDITGNTLTQERLRALCAITTKGRGCMITTSGALMNRIPGLETIAENVITIKTGEEWDLNALKKHLLCIGYSHETTVTEPGQFASRGGIIDVYPITADEPVRIEFWDREIDSIRTFTDTTQKSTGTVDEVFIYPATELILNDDTVSKGCEAIKKDYEKIYKKYREEMKTEDAFRLKSEFGRILEEFEDGFIPKEAESMLSYFYDETYSLLDYLPEKGLIFLDEPTHLIASMQSLEKEFSDSMMHRIEHGYALPGQAHMLLASSEIFAKCTLHPGVMFTSLDTGTKEIKPTAHYFLRSSSLTAYNGNVELLIKELHSYAKRKMRCVLVSTSRTRSQRLANDLMDEGLHAYYSENYDSDIYPGDVLLTTGRLRAGYELPDSGYVFISESDIFGKAVRKKRRKKYEGGEHIQSLSDLMVGDYVVHENYGLGIYQGLERMERDHVMRDYVKISYAKGSNLYVPATQLDAISKYGAMSDKKPKLNVLGGGDWAKTKQRVRKAVDEVAKDLVELYAQRANMSGYVYGPDTVWQKEFEETFPYDETDSQLAAIEDVKNDMMSPRIMDRLICGDVGYGKTEIALRAAFKAVMDSKQVVFLCPTTILARQHYQTFASRMRDYPVNIGQLSRFRSDKENRETVKGLKDGTIDIVIGTHRALSKDVEFKDLGLLIIDEEQRFGVRHKEKIKQMKNEVDVLSLSATPIPRTLHMSMIGIRDMSLLEDAPVDRTPIQTFVFEQNDEMVREAIEREMDRGGQVYYVINRVRVIADIADHIQKLVPDASVAYAHGKMSKDELEDIMSDFIDKQIDVLVATTIIEIGIDISNVNTIIIHDANKLGLSQLYQLRGRVGRSNRTAYAFLMYKPNTMLREVAEKRLAAIKEFTALGSGFKIAMRDLSIRGAGNLLGEAQSGHMEAVGYELYVKMLGAAISREKGETPVTKDYDTLVDIKIDAYIPEDYIPDIETRLSMYKRIAAISNEEEQTDMLDELIDRFGEPKKCVQNLLFVARLRALAHDVYITELRQNENGATIKLYNKALFDVAAIPGFVESEKPYLTFNADINAPSFTVDRTKNNRLTERDFPQYLYDLVLKMKEILLPPELPTA